MIFVCNISGDVCTNVACEFITGDNGALICDGETLIGDCEREDERLRPPRGVFVLLFELLLLYATENTAS